MSRRVLIALPDEKSTQLLVNLFQERGDQPQFITTPEETLIKIEQDQLELLVVDLRLVNNGWEDTVQQISHHFPKTKILFASNYPDPKLETKIREMYLTPTILRQPFTRTDLELALQSFESLPQDTSKQKSSVDQAARPKVRMPVRVKITLPYVLLALVLAIAAAYVVSQVVLDTIEERFTNQLIEAGKLTNDWIVREEDRLLETLRLVAHTREMPAAVQSADAEKLRELILPLAVNYQEDVIDILDLQGVSLLSLRHRSGGKLEDYSASRGETIFSQWDFVAKAINQQVEGGRDKYAGLARAPWGDHLYVVGPILDDQGEQVGTVLVGKALTTLVRQIRQDTLAHTTIYDLNGHPLASTLLLAVETGFALSPDEVTDVLNRQDDDSLRRPMNLASIDYSEIIGPWEVRESLATQTAPRGNNDLGLLGVSLAETFLAQPSQITRMQIFVLTAITFVLVIVLGFYLANRITHPLLRIVTASAQVAEGDLDVQVNAAGNDEVAVLAHSFNQMVSGLKEGSLYRDILGRTVSPEVREELRQSFASGAVRLEGQEAVATVLVGKVRGFTTLAETEDPTTILNWLNEYYDKLIPIITSHGGVISRLEGDEILAFFGILPRLLPPQAGALQASQAALAMLAGAEALNAQRLARSEPPLTTGISLNTGPVTAGGLGSADRLHYTIIGDTVNTTELLERVTRQFGEASSAIMSQHTLFALRDQRHQFELESLGVQNIRGKEEQLLIYRLSPAPEAP
jgi:adenylate cyclase